MSPPLLALFALAVALGPASAGVTVQQPIEYSEECDVAALTQEAQSSQERMNEILDTVTPDCASILLDEWITETSTVTATETTSSEFGALDEPCMTHHHEKMVRVLGFAAYSVNVEKRWCWNLDSSPDVFPQWSSWWTNIEDPVWREDSIQVIRDDYYVYPSIHQTFVIAHMSRSAWPDRHHRSSDASLCGDKGHYRTTNDCT